MNITPRSKDNHQRPEPIIVAPLPTLSKKSHTNVRRQIITFDDDDDEDVISSASSSGSVPKSLSGMCLKYKEEPTVSNSKQEYKLPKIEQNETVHSDQSCVDIYAAPESPSLVKFVDTSNGDPYIDIMKICFPADPNPTVVEGNNVIGSEEEDLLANAERETDTTSSDMLLADNIVENTTNITTSTSNESSLHSSMNSVKSNDYNVAILRDQLLRDAMDRCQLLESRVAELSLYV